MGKEGPCYHCGVTSTPLWRNGPPEKPVLCNACGSRWRTKGTLTNYAPLHSRAVADEYEEPRVSKVKTLSLKERDGKLKKRKLSYENSVVKRPASNYNQDFLKITYEDTSNRSSSGSAVSNSESCAHFTSADASDLTGLAQSAAWESQQAPSKKRTCVIRTKSSPVEKLIKDLHAILHEQESSCVSGFSEEELLFESDEPMVSVEIGHGSVLIKHPSSLVREEESEATSFSLENKSSAVNDAYSCAASFDKLNYLKGDSVSYHGSENVSKLTGQQMHEELAKREMQKQLFWTHDSPLCYIDLNEVINFEVLLGHLTIDEQHQLLKYLPSSDAYQFPQSLQETFDSDCFKENLSYFQELLSEGVFSSSSTGVKSEDFRTLKKLALSNLTKSKWLGLYRKLKDSRSNHDARESPISSGSKLSLLKDLGRSKRPLLDQNKHMLDKETTIRGSKRGLFKSSLETKEPLESDRSLFTQGNQFGLLTDGVESFYLPDESSDQDLLLDVPSNASFPEAELLLPTSSFQISASSSYTHPGMINH